MRKGKVRRARRFGWSLVGLSVVAVALSVVVSASANPPRQPVLGVKSFIFHGDGWGTVAPKQINNNGDPGGNVDTIRWKRWGQQTATGTGLGSVPPVHGTGWVGGQRVLLRATRLGHCVHGGPPAYQQLYARYPVRPGGPLGPWQRWWPSSRDICHPAN